MVVSVVARKRTIASKPKVKTGCGICRIRKIKCDENKPYCQKCVTTGRTCDGYQSPFRLVTTHAGGIKVDVSIPRLQSTLLEITPQDIDLLNRYFSVKTIFDVQLGCDEEARQVLEASLTDAPIRHAILSLRALRQDFETSGDGPASVAQQTPSYHYGLEQYGMALRGLVSNLSCSNPDRLKSVLLCCHVFISIEQVRKNYAAMVQHMIRGLRIMHEYHVRPGLGGPDTLVPAHRGQLPLLDVFIIKLFTAPCKFAEPPAMVDVGETTTSSSPSSITSHQEPPESRGLRTIAPNTRTELIRIAASTTEFLDKVSQVESARTALGLLPEKAALLNSLELWLSDLELIQTEIGYPDPEPVAVSFSRLFYLILKIVLLGALDSSPDVDAELGTEIDRLQTMANHVSERVSTYTICSGANSGRSEHCTGR